MGDSVFQGSPLHGNTLGTFEVLKIPRPEEHIGSTPIRPILKENSEFCGQNIPILPLEDLPDSRSFCFPHSLRVWVLCLHFMRLNLSNEQIAAEFRPGRGRCTDHDHATAGWYRGQKEPVQLTGVIEADEVYIVAGHKGHPDIVAQEGRPGEYARDDDGDGFHEVHVNTLEGFWSLLRSWLRPHRGISQEKLPLYLGFFEFVHNARRRGKALIHVLLAALVAP